MAGFEPDQYKVLRDLEAQRDTVSERNARSPLVQDNLRPVRSIKPRLSRQQLCFASAVVATVAVGVFAWNQWSVKLLLGGKAPVAPKAAAPAPAPAKVATAPAAPGISRRYRQRRALSPTVTETGGAGGKTQSLS